MDADGMGFEHKVYQDRKSTKWGENKMRSGHHRKADRWQPRNMFFPFCLAGSLRVPSCSSCLGGAILRHHRRSSAFICGFILLAVLLIAPGWSQPPAPDVLLQRLSSAALKAVRSDT